MRNVIVHLTANELTVDGKDLAGCIGHYARLEDAAKRGKYVRSVVCRCDDRYDYLGRLYETFKEQEA